MNQFFKDVWQENKSLILVPVILGLCCIAANIQAKTVYVLLSYEYTELSGAKIYQDRSSITVKTDSNCEIPDYTPATLDTTNDTLIYTAKVAALDANDSPILVDRNIICNVRGTIDADENSILITEAIFDTQSAFLTINNLLIMKGYDTQDIYKKATLQYNFDTETFDIIEVIK